MYAAATIVIAVVITFITIVVFKDTKPLSNPFECQNKLWRKQQGKGQPANKAISHSMITIIITTTDVT
jgi:hypothetical protein